MRILGNPKITDAAVSATNIATEAQSDKLKTFQLTDKMITTSSETVIDFEFATDQPEVNAVALCGTNLSPSAVITFSYSDTNIETPDATVTFDTFSNLNQVLFLPSVIQKKYNRVSIVDSGNSTLFIGYLYVGKYFQVPSVDFGHSAEQAIFSNAEITATGQGYGSKLYNSFPVSFTMNLNYSELEEYLILKRTSGGIDPVVMVEYEESYDLSLYRPKYGVLSASEIAFPMVDDPLFYKVEDRLTERF